MFSDASSTSSKKKAKAKQLPISLALSKKGKLFVFIVDQIAADVYEATRSERNVTVMIYPI